jgi:hypothetical protein
LDQKKGEADGQAADDDETHETAPR